MLSLGELEALCRKAARGAGMDWGTADEAGSAVRRLAAFNLPGAELFLARLDACDGRPARELLPRSLDGTWRSNTDKLCPILAGTTLTDNAARLAGVDNIVLSNVLSPLLIAPFASVVAQLLGQPVSLSWGDVVAIDDGDTLRLNGGPEQWLDTKAASVHFNTGPMIATFDGDPRTRVSRAWMNQDCLEKLDAYAHRTYAPATDESRQKGAGGVQADDD